TDKILSAVLRVSLGESGECYLVNREGKFLAHKEPKRILTENIAQSDSFKNIFNSQRDKIAYIDYRGIEVIGASVKVGGTDWALVVEQDRAEAFQSADRLKKYIYLAIVLSTCGALISAWLLSNYLVGPIRRLSTAAGQLAGGQFESVGIQTDRTDEIGSLYTAFRDMARQLQDRQLRLEEKIVLREAELKRTDVRLKETQLAAARSQKLAALGQLAAGVAHEIRTPLTSLKLFLQSVESEIAVSIEYEEDFRMAMDQVRRMEATINRFLEFARPQEPVLALVRVEKLIEDSLLLLKPRAKQQETSIRTIIQEGLPEINGDKEQLGEALLNLMVNALEAISFRGELTVTASRDELIEHNGRWDCVRIDIKDTGPGIEKDNIIKLFDPFFTTKATGAGLGLSIVYSTIQRHGGEVQVVSNVGRGTTFSVLIPTKVDG
ncbi:MAG: ATP-binding protein, partial [Desulforhabdus sp.]|nr:ATP-binding protein [Desulforhabdus sp.]